MYAAFFDEFEKVAFQRGEGSRGGKVVGHTKSGDPIYASSQKSKGPGQVRATAQAKRPEQRQDNTAKWVKRGLLAGGVALAGYAVARKVGQAKRFKRAADRYAAAGGPGTRGQGSKWKEYTQAGDDFFGGNNEGWSRAKKKTHDYHKQYKYYNQRAQSKSWGSGGSAGSRSTSAGAGKAAYTHIPDLGKVKTKKDAQRAYKAAARKHHPDLGGDPEQMKKVNTAWNDFKQSPLYEKLAMVYWSKLASALIR